MRTLSQAILFDGEVKGQLSDGAWENASPSNHWEPWCSALTCVSQDNPGRDFDVRRSRYDLSGELIPVVGDRMLVLVRLGTVYGPHNVGMLRHLFDLNGVWHGIPLYEGESWDRVRFALCRFLNGSQGLEQVRQTATTRSYNLLDLKRDLDAIADYMRIRRQPPKLRREQ